MPESAELEELMNNPVHLAAVVESHGPTPPGFADDATEES